MSVDAALTAHPVNAAVLVGHNVTLECRTNTTRGLAWLFNGGKITSGNDVAPGINDVSVDADEQSGKYNLVLHSVQLSHANEYLCFEDNTFQSQASLVALGKMSLHTTLS